MSRQITVVFHSIRQGLWRVTAQPKFWFQHSQNLAMTRPEIRQYTAAGRKIILCWDSDHQTVSALEKNACYHRYISAILKAAWRVTAKLNEILQYLRLSMAHALLHIFTMLSKPLRRDLIDSFLLSMATWDIFSPPENLEEYTLNLQKALELIALLEETHYLNDRPPVPKLSNIDLAWEDSFLP